MKLEEKELGKAIADADMDCVWLCFKGNQFFKAPLLQELDWKLCGMLSKFFGKPPATTTFLPTMKRIRPAFIVVENSLKGNWDNFCRQCEGLKVKTVSLITDNHDCLNALKKLAAKSDVAYPEKVVLMMAPEG